MKKRYWLLLSLVVIAILIIIYWSFKDIFPPRTGYKVARIYSGLNISEDNKIIKYREDYSFTGNGIIQLVIRLDDNNINDIEREIQNKAYKKINDDDLNEIVLKITFTKDLLKTNNIDVDSWKGAFYMMNINDGHSMKYSIVVVDLRNRILLISAVI